LGASAERQTSREGRRDRQEHRLEFHGPRLAAENIVANRYQWIDRHHRKVETSPLVRQSLPELPRQCRRGAVAPAEARPLSAALPGIGC
jgi:hypothetical protein